MSFVGREQELTGLLHLATLKAHPIWRLLGQNRTIFPLRMETDQIRMKLGSDNSFYHIFTQI
jgi:hypothetical protein